MFIGKILLVMGMHSQTRSGIYAQIGPPRKNSTCEAW